MEKTKVLLVDDEIDFIDLMRVRLENWGHEVLTAANGKEAVEAVKAQDPDVVILDYMMPDMDGVATLRKIRDINRKLPVIMFTAHPDIKVIKGTERLGVSAFIPKLSIYSDTQSALKSSLDLIKRDWKK